ncbi:MAG: right-handed parallel beta-helix repeat-containing protein [Candidatus Micrarchaeia archaeon]
MSSNVSTDGATCFNITAANITLDCAGYTITGSNTSNTFGVYSNQHNTTVKNCVIRDFYRGIYYSGSSNSSVLNNTVSRCSYSPIDVRNGSNITIANNSASFAGTIDGVVAANANNCLIENNTAFNNTRAGFLDFAGDNVSSYNNVWKNNFAYNNTNSGMLITQLLNSTIQNFTVSSVVGEGINIAYTLTGNTSNVRISGLNINVPGNGINNTRGPNLYIDCLGGSITGNNASSTYGVYSNQPNTTVKNCVISGFERGIYASGADSLIESNNLTITNTPFVAWNSRAAIMPGGDNTVVRGNRITTAGNYGSSHGVYLYLTGTRINITSNYINLTGITNTPLPICRSAGATDFIIHNNTLVSAGSTSQDGDISNLNNGANNVLVYENTIYTAYGESINLRNYTTTNWTIRNNTLIGSNVSTGIQIGQLPSGILVYNNNITAGVWIDNANETNYFNTTGAGNIYYLANGTPSWNVFSIYNDGSSNWATSGSSRPFNATTVGGNWSGVGQDYHPYTSSLGCRVLSTANSVTTLSSDVSIDGATCFNITAANVTLDCNGFSISGGRGAATYGIYSTAPYTTVKNCRISDFGRAIQLHSGWGTITNNTVWNNSVMGIFLVSSNYTVVANNTASLTLNYDGFATQSSHDCRFENNTAWGNGRAGFLDYLNSYENVWSNNAAYNNTRTGMFVVQAINSTIYNLSVVSTNGSGFSVGMDGYAAASEKVRVVGLNISTTGNGTHIISGSNVSIDCAGGSIIGSNSTSTYGIYSNQSNTTAKNCVIRDFDWGIAFDKTDSAAILNNTITQMNGSFSSSARALAVSYGETNCLVANNRFTCIDCLGGALAVGKLWNSVVANNTLNYTFSGIAPMWAALQTHNSANNTFQNNTIYSSGYGIGISQAAANMLHQNNTYINNTILNASVGIQGFNVSYEANNYFYYNNITASIWVNGTNETNYFNTTGAGNIYYFANGTPSWNVFNILNNGSSNWATSGSSRPFNATTVGGNWSGSGQDWYPFTNVSRPNLSIASNVSFTNSTAGHWFYANATASDANGGSDITSWNISTNIGACVNYSNSTSGNNLTVVFNCSGIAFQNATVNITFADSANSTASTSGTNAYPNNIPTISNVTISPSTPTTSTNISASANGVSDPDGDNTTVIYNWLVNDTQYAIVNMPFDTNISSTTAKAVRDYTGYNNGTLGGGVAAKSPTWTQSGYSGGAYYLNGTQFINLSNSASLNLSRYATFSIWVKPNSSWVNYAQIIDKSSASSTSYRMQRYSSTNSLEFYDGTNVLYGGTIVTGAWNHLAVVVNNGTATGYINGTQVFNGGVFNQLTQLNTSVLIGSEYGNTQGMTGFVDQLMIFNRSLSASEVLALYLNGSQVIASSELGANSNWTAQAWANDQYNDSDMVSSNTTVLSSAPTIVSNITFTNASAGHWFYANATANYSLGGQHLVWNASTTSGTCINYSSSISGVNLSVVFNCSGVALSNATVNITFFNDSSKASTFGWNKYPNQLPNVTNASIEPSTVYKSTAYINCTNGTVSDADGDNVNLTYRWFINGSVVSAQTSRNITNSYYNKSDEIICELTPFDGYQNGSPVNSSAVTVSNSLPSIQNLSMSNLTQMQIVYCFANITDGDGQTDLVWTNFTLTNPNGTIVVNNVNGTILNTTYYKSNSFNLSVWGDWICSVQATDKSNASVTLNGTFTVIREWQKYYGATLGQLKLGSGISRFMLNWSTTHGKTVYIAEPSVNVSFTYIYPLGVCPNGSLHTGTGINDFTSADSALSLSSASARTISGFFDNGSGFAIATESFSVFGRNVSNVPVAKISTSSPFSTGIFWQGTAGSNVCYNGVQDLVFAVRINSSSSGVYGSSDYEIMIPVQIASYKTPSNSLVAFYGEYRGQAD